MNGVENLIEKRHISYSNVKKGILPLDEEFGLFNGAIKAMIRAFA